MSKLPSLHERRVLQQIEDKIRLLEANKARAREQLLRIQLLLAQRPLKS